MRVTHDNIDVLDPPASNDVIACCVTTNGIVKRDGSAVMGAGIAKQAVARFGEGLSAKLGIYLSTYGNRAFNLGRYKTRSGNTVMVLSFPTKNHWRDGSDLGLIERSAEQLRSMADKFGLTRVYLPAVGCGCGGLGVKDVTDRLSPILDDRFVMVLR